MYDINVERINKVRQYLKRFLDWVQNSVFEGELTKAELRKIKREIGKLIDEKEDTVLIYSSREKRHIERELIGIEKGETSNIL